MADAATRDDVQRAVRDGLNDIKNDINRIKDGVQKIDQRTDDLDRSQDEIKQVARLMEEVRHDADKIDKVVVDINDLRAQLQATNQYLQKVASYLAAMDERERVKDTGDGYHKD